MGWGVNLSVRRPYAAHCKSNWSVWLSSQKEAPFKDAQVSPQTVEKKHTKDMDYWNHVLWSDETKINLFGSDGVKRVWQQPGEEYKVERQACLAYSQAWWWKCHGLGLHECCRHWGATVH